MITPTGSPFPTILIAPFVAGVPAGTATTLDVLVRVQAPDADPTATRPPFDLALVLDRSGSMGGQPLAEVKRCAELVVERLAATDRLAMVTYDHRVDVIAPLASVADRDRLRRTIRSISEGGQTNLHGGWRAGADQLAASGRPEAVRRVLLLSDGCANKGETDPLRIQVECAQLSILGISTSTYGLGRRFNEDLMTGMAAAGQGQASYGDTVDDLRETFESELDLLRATFGSQVAMAVRPAPGVQVTLLNQYRIGDDGTYHLPLLPYGAEVWALLRPAIDAQSGETIHVFDTTVSWTDAKGARQTLAVPPFVLPILPQAKHQALPVNELVDRRLAEIEAAELHSMARVHLGNGDVAMAEALLEKARALGKRSAWVAEVNETLAHLLANFDPVVFRKESSYHAHQMKNRPAAQNETQDGTDGGDVASWLRRKRRQGKSGG